VQRLRNCRWRLTPQRRAIVAALDAAGGHFSAEEVHAMASTNLLPISLATVYNTLGSLVDMGMLGEVRLSRGATRFDTNSGPHGHLACRSCGRLIDVDLADLDGIDLVAIRGAAAARHSFKAEGIDVVVRGRCSHCSRRA
jgi:Fur family ferric uptake transcriptional regulator